MSSGVEMDTGAVSALGQEFEHLADAVGAGDSGAVAFAGGSGLNPECFGKLPSSGDVGKTVVESVQQLAQSLGHAGAFMAGAVTALKQAAGVTQANEDQTAQAIAKTGQELA